MTAEHKRALRLAAEQRWDDAHRLIQQHSDPLSCAIHGYLHRVEGDLANARYWYRRAALEMLDNTLEDEWRRLDERAG